MSQIDTGLGWSAKSGWLTLGSGVIAAFTEFDDTNFPDQPLAVGYSVADFRAAGFKYGRQSPYEFYAMSEREEIYIFTVGREIHFCSRVKDAKVWLRQKSGDTWYTANERTCSVTSYYNTYGWYCTDYTQGSFQTTSPNFSSVAEGFNALNAAFLETPIYKLNSGYAVACVARWWTPEGTEQLSPILISTNQDYVTLSLDGTTPYANQYTNIRNYNGVTFYMSMIINNTDDIIAKGITTIDLSSFGAAAPSKVFALIADESLANIIVIDSPDPYEEDDGESEEGGNDGEEDDPEDVDFTDPPSTAIGATGFLTIFCPNLSQLQSLANYMWTTFDIDNWRKIIANPMDAILGLHIIPVPPYISGTKTISVAGISTGLSMDYTTIRYIRRPMGSCDIPKKWGAYLDYSPYTKTSIFLPYIGFQELNVDDIMGLTISLQYMIDILSGACVAELKCGDTVLYSWTGNCANPVPFSSSSWASTITGALSIAATIAKLAISGGSDAPMIPGAIASIGANSFNLKPTISRSGSIGGSAGFIAGQRPYIIRTAPNLVIPANQNRFIGYPSFVTVTLGSLTGYNEISAIHLEGIPATANELSEIESLLKGGVLF